MSSTQESNEHRHCDEYYSGSSDCELSDDENEEQFEDDSLRSVCLFCSDIFDSPHSTFEHIKQIHGLDFVSICVRNKFDAISYIKIINYIRENKIAAIDVGDNLSRNLWSEEKFMKPCLEDDALLTFDIEELTEEPMTENEVVDGKQPQQNIDELRIKLAMRERELDFFRKLFDDCDSPTQELEVRTSSTEDYFESYSHFSIHHEMLSDKIRTECYRDAILGNKLLFDGSTVLDIGCGTGILSLFAASSGAKSVTAVDNSEIIYKAIDIAHENGLEKKMEFVKARLEDKPLNKQFDVIVSEWMGYLLIFEGMLDTVLYARDNLLKPNGVLMPNRCALFVSAVSNINNYEKFVTFWDNVYGFKMSSMKSDYFNEVTIEVVSADDICSDTVLIKDLDLMKCTLLESQFIESNFVLKCTKTCQLTAITIWFDCFFDSDQLSENKVTLSTSPFTTPTHWKQSILPLRSPIPVTNGTIVEGSISIKRLKQEPRCLNVTLSIKGKEVQCYTMR